MADIVVIGSLAMDLIAVVDKFPEAGETIIARSSRKAPGGKGLNQAVAAARLGGSVEMIGMVGNDADGKYLRNILKEEGIEDRFLFVSEEAPTGYAQIQVDSSGQNSIVVVSGANHAFGMKELDAADAALREAKIVVVQLELNVDIIEEAVKRAKQYGAITILDPAPSAGWKSSMIQYADYLTPNESELAAISGMSTDTTELAVEAARSLIAKGAKMVLTTLGGAGAAAVSANEVVKVPVFEVKAIDSVGAGDSFNGAFAVKLNEEAPLMESLRFANAEGALTVTVEGAIPALHTRAEVEGFLAKQLV